MTTPTRRVRACRRTKPVAYALVEPKPAVATGSRRRAAGTNAVLTKREWEVAELVASGLTNQAIATRLVISRRTAEGRVENILRKLGCTSRARVVTWLIDCSSPS